MRQRPPAKLTGYFASSAPVCVIVRRGPSRYSQLILWKTDTDEFLPGQWMKGRVRYASLNSDGSYMAIGVTEARSRTGARADTQYSLICRPPYFTALELWFGSLDTNLLEFRRGDVIACPSNTLHKVNTPGECPFKKVQSPAFRLYFPFWMYPRSLSVTDQRGRRILFDSGKVFVVEEGAPRMLFDANLYDFGPVEPPEWARDWGPHPILTSTDT